MSLTIERDDWRDVAACRDTDPDLFFPVGTTGPAIEQIDNAKAVCQAVRGPDRLPRVRPATNQDSGIWGGTSEEERRKLRRQWLAATARPAPEPPAPRTGRPDLRPVHTPEPATTTSPSEVVVASRPTTRGRRRGRAPAASRRAVVLDADPSARPRCPAARPPWPGAPRWCRPARSSPASARSTGPGRWRLVELEPRRAGRRRRRTRRRRSARRRRARSRRARARALPAASRSGGKAWSTAFCSSSVSTTASGRGHAGRQLAGVARDLERRSGGRAR